MTAGITTLDEDTLVERIDIVEFIGQFTKLDLRNDGEYWGCTPFGLENTPSFSVNPQKKVWYDYSTSGKCGGNVVSFVMKMFHCNVEEAMKKLAEYLGDDVQSITIKQKSTLDKLESVLIMKNHGIYTDIENHPCKVSSMTFNRNPEKLKLWVDDGILWEVLVEWGVAYDPFSNSIVYPIYDHKGVLVNWGARALDFDPKNKKRPKYIYKASWEHGANVIYGLNKNLEAITAKHEIILFEGAKSVLKCNGWNIRQTGALLTSKLNTYQLNLLIRLRVKVVFALDKDVDIMKDKNIQILSHYCDVSYIKDDHDLLRAKESPVDRGIKVFCILYSQRRAYISPKKLALL